MDLHDYSDVAENYDLYLDVMYKNQDNHEGFQDFYLDLAREYGQGGCIDIALGLNLKIFPANMTEFKSNKKYSLAIIARSGFMHLTTPELQRAALLNIRENLVDGGILTLNTFDPHPYFQAQQMNTKDTDYSFRLEYVNKNGQKEKIYNAIGYDPTTQIMSGNWKFETLDDAGNVIEERIRPLKMRQTYRQEMKYLVELFGFEVVTIYGDYHKTVAETVAKNVIWVLKKK